MRRDGKRVALPIAEFVALWLAIGVAVGLVIVRSCAPPAEAAPSADPQFIEVGPRPAPPIKTTNRPRVR